MPDTTLSEAVQEALTLCPTDVRHIQTIEIRQPGRSFDASVLELAFLVDTTGSMNYLFETLRDALVGLAANLQTEYASVRFSLIEFKGTDENEDGEDEDPPVLKTGTLFVPLETVQIALETLEISGGGDIPEDGYGAIVLATTDLQWTDVVGAAKVIFMLTDADSHERMSTRLEALEGLTDRGVVFFYGPYGSLGEEGEGVGYRSLAAATNGAQIPESDFMSPELLKQKLSSVISDIEEEEASNSIYLVNDNQALTAFLEPAGDAAPLEVTFGTRPFSLNTAGSGEDGVKGIGITIDNTDLQVSRYLAKAALRSAPVEIIVRVYLAGDPSGPQNSPPITLYLGPVETQGNVVSGEARWIDIQNAPFPKHYYTKQRFPGL